MCRRWLCPGLLLHRWYCQIYRTLKACFNRMSWRTTSMAASIFPTKLSKVTWTSTSPTLSRTSMPTNPERWWRRLLHSTSNNSSNNSRHSTSRLSVSIHSSTSTCPSSHPFTKLHSSIPSNSSNLSLPCLCLKTNIWNTKMRRCSSSQTFSLLEQWAAMSYLCRRTCKILGF
jgi:hypothetical protein